MLSMSAVRPLLRCFFVLYCVGFCGSAQAHSMYQGALLLDFRDNDVRAELQLPAERVQAALGVQVSPHMSEVENARIAAYILQNLSASLPDRRTFEVKLVDQPHSERIEGAPYIVARLHLMSPAGTSAELFELHCGVLLDRIPAQVILASIQTDWRTSTFANDPQLIAVLHGSEQTVHVDRRNGNWWNGFGSVFKLGMRHIAEGTDHLLFLLALLLPAPLLDRANRWVGYSDVRRCLVKIAGVVTAFTIGHSITLAAGALDLVHVPSRPIETLIAVSILVSAIHAFRPLFPGREAAIAGFFGLIHGLAFAATLAELGLGRWERVASIFGFNLGIETMQLIVVIAALPSLVLLSRTRLYGAIRTGGALFAGIAAAGWVAQRLWDLPNPADAVVTSLAHGAVWVALGLTLLGMVASSTTALRLGRSNPVIQTETP
jgi:HupE / UreJ protein